MLATKDLRAKVLMHYGHACVDCGEDDADKLTIDHIQEDGGEQRRTLKRHSSQWYKWIIDQGYPDDLALRCWNCNVAKQRRYQQDKVQGEEPSMSLLGKIQINPSVRDDTDTYLKERMAEWKCRQGEAIDRIIQAYRSHIGLIVEIHTKVCLSPSTHTEAIRECAPEVSRKSVDDVEANDEVSATEEIPAKPWWRPFVRP